MRAAFLLLLLLALALPARATTYVYAGTDQQVTVELQAGTPPFEYQWFKDGKAIAGENGSALKLLNVTGAAAGAYHVTVKNTAGQTTSPDEVLVVEMTPPQGASVKISPLPKATIAPTAPRMP